MLVSVDACFIAVLAHLGLSGDVLLDYPSIKSLSSFRNFQSRALLQEDVLFVKRYKSHKGAVSALEVSATGDMCVSMCLDGTVKVYDVATFDMIVMLRLTFVPGCCAFMSHSRAAQQVLAISDLNDPKVYTFDVSSGSEEPLKCLDAVHQAPVTCMRLCGPSSTVRNTLQCTCCPC